MPDLQRYQTYTSTSTAAAVPAIIRQAPSVAGQTRG